MVTLGGLYKQNAPTPTGWKAGVGSLLKGASALGEKIGGPQEAFGKASQLSGDIATGIKNLGYSDDSEEKKRQFIQDHLDKGYSVDAITEALKVIDSQGGFQGGVLSNPITGPIASVAAAPFQAAQTYTSGLSKFGEASTNLAKGKITLGVSQAAQGGVTAGLGALGLATGFTPAGAAVNTIFSSDTVAEPIGKVSEGAQKLTAGAQKIAGFDPFSEASKSVQETVGTLAPLAALGAGQRYVAPKISPYIQKAGTFIKKTPSISETQQKVTTGVQAVGSRYKNISNAAAEKMLSDQWKLTKPVRDKLTQGIGETGPKFALERDLIGKDIESTADNVGAYKIKKMQEKINAVKTFGETTTPEVAKNVAYVLKKDIMDATKKSYGVKENKVLETLTRDHPEMARVYALTDEVINSPKTEYVKLEQLKELHDYLNPEGIQYDVSGKPISETANILSAGKRGKLQSFLEDAGNKNGVDIKGINKDIRGAYTLEKGLNDAVGRRSNAGILGLGDTQIAVISSLLGGAPLAAGAVLLKKGLTSEGFVGGLAKKLYFKDSKNAKTNTVDNAMTGNPPVSRMGRIMDYTTGNTANKGIGSIIKPINPIEQSTTKSTPPAQPTPTTPPIIKLQTKPTTKIVKGKIEAKVDKKNQFTDEYLTKEFARGLPKDGEYFTVGHITNLKEAFESIRKQGIEIKDGATFAANGKLATGKNEYIYGGIKKQNIDGETRYTLSIKTNKGILEETFVEKTSIGKGKIEPKKESIIKPTPKIVKGKIEPKKESTTPKGVPKIVNGKIEPKNEYEINPKLIEEAKKYDYSDQFWFDKLPDTTKTPTMSELLDLGFNKKQIENNIFNHGLSLEDLFYELKTGRQSSYRIGQKGKIEPTKESALDKGIDIAESTMSLIGKKFNSLGSLTKTIGKIPVGVMPIQNEDGTWTLTLAPRLGAFIKGKKLGLFGGEKAKIKPKTGWTKGADGKMRFEIDDSKAVLIKKIKDEGKTYASIGELLKHDELFYQYPGLKDMDITINIDKNIKSSNAEFVPYENRESQGLFDIQPEIKINTNNKKDIKSTLLHELQHAIQEKEGFSKGGSPEGFDYLNSKDEMLSSYKSLAGEVESRNVQSRMLLTKEQRGIKPPESTEDVPRSKQIIRLQGEGKSMSLPEKSLIEEAKKYKSAEEFVKNQGITVYHGSNKKFTSGDEINVENGFYTLRATDESIANQRKYLTKEFDGRISKISLIEDEKLLNTSEIAELKKMPIWDKTPQQTARSDELTRKAKKTKIEKDGISIDGELAKYEKDPSTAFGKNVNEFVVNFKNPLTVDYNGKGWRESGTLYDTTAELIEKAKTNKNDGIIIKNINEGFTFGADRSAGIVDDYIVLDKNTIKTKSQLLDIYNKTHEGIKPVDKSLIEEAKKFKSAEDFVKSQGTTIYHGSNEKINIFSNKKGAQGVIWFTDNPKVITAGESGAKGTKVINERITTGKKFAGWDEYEKLGLGQIEDMGFDGIKLPSEMNDGTKYNNYVLFDNKTIKTKSQLLDIYNKAHNK